MNVNEIEILTAAKDKLMDMEIISYIGAQDDVYRNKIIELMDLMIKDRKDKRGDR